MTIHEMIQEGVQVDDGREASIASREDWRNEAIICSQMASMKMGNPHAPGFALCSIAASLIRIGDLLEAQSKPH